MRKRPFRVVKTIRDWSESKVVEVELLEGPAPRRRYGKLLRGGDDRELAVYRFAAKTPGFPAPRAELARDGEQVWLLLEPAQGQMLYRVRDRALYLRAVRELAAFHRRGVVEGWPERLKELGSILDGLDPMAVLHATRLLAEEGHYRKVDLALLDLVTQRVAAVWPTVAAALRRDPATLVHGDAHDGHLFITPEGRITLIDWASAGIGPGLLDLAALVDVADRMGDGLCSPEEMMEAYLEVVGEGYKEPAQAWGHVRVLRALLELRWFVGTGEDYGARVNRELHTLDRYLPHE